MIDYELDGHVAVITINRPEARNAVNGDVANGIEAAIDQLEADDEAWVGILTGARTEKGYIFCAGADLKADQRRPGRQLATERGGFGGIVQRERDQADHRRRRRPGAGRRHRDRPGLRPRRGLDRPPRSASPR